MKKDQFKCVLALILLLVLASCSESDNDNRKEKTHDETIVFANLVPFWWNAQPVLIDFENISGVKVKTVEVQTGKESKNIVLNGGADIGIVAASPLVMSAQAKEKGFKVVARYMDGPELVGVLSKSESNEGLNPPIAIVEGTVSEFVMIAHATRNGIEMDTDEFITLNSRPPSIINHFKTESANSTVIWEPFAQQIIEDAAINLNYMEYPKNLYNMKFFLIVNVESLNTKRKAIEKVVKEFERMSRVLQEDRIGKYREQIEQFFNYDSGSLKGRWEKVSFEFVTDKKTILRDLHNESKIILDAGKIDKYPEFSSFF